MEADTFGQIIIKITMYKHLKVWYNMLINNGDHL
jgi:hypothetical protein